MGSKSAVDIPEDRIAEFCKRHNILVFGSALRNDFGPSNDVDILVEFHPEAKVSLLDMARLQRELTEIIGRNVDLRTPAELSRYFRDEVLANAEVHYDAV